MDDQSMTQQDTFGATQAATTEQTEGRSGTQVMSDLQTAGTGAGAAQTGSTDGAVSDSATEAKASAGPDVDALQARIADLARQNGDLTDRLARIDADEAAATEAATRRAAEIEATAEADAAAAAVARMQTLRNTAAEAWTAYRMAGLCAVNAAVVVRAGVYDPNRLADGIAGIAEWSDKATGAILALGDLAHLHGSVPSPDVLDADTATFRAQAQDNLINLATAAASYAELLRVAPNNLPAQAAIGRSLDECFFAASLTLTGLGATLTARSFA